MLIKIRNLFHRLRVCCSVLPIDIGEFGISIALHRFVDILLPVGKRKSYIEALSAYMIDEMRPLTQSYSQKRHNIPQSKIKLDMKPIWVCWWQGEKNMPDLVRMCIKRLRSCLPTNAKLHIISFENVNEYVDLPDYILEKFRLGIISYAHLSDVLRFALLSCYGGAWLDATVFLANEFPIKLLTEEFYTQCFTDWRKCPQEACRGKWCGFFLGGSANNELFSYMYEALCIWWKQHNKAVDYVFFDYILWAGYCGIPNIKELIEAVEPHSENIWLMNKFLNEAYDPKKITWLIEQNSFYKLSHKGSLDLLTKSGEKTIYAHFLEENY